MQSNIEGHGSVLKNRGASVVNATWYIILGSISSSSSELLTVSQQLYSQLPNTNSKFRGRISISKQTLKGTVFFSHNKSASAGLSVAETISRTAPRYSRNVAKQLLLIF